jgi:micrococcal nuclease
VSRHHPARRTVLALALLLAVPGCALVDRGDDPLPRGSATVVHVIDGDTVDLLVGRRAETARLLGVDTPETVKPGAPVDCFGPEASARTKALLPPGTEVRLTRDVEVRDRFERLLVYVVRAEDDLFVNRALVADGYARTLSIAPNDAHEADLAAAEADAREQGRGLWGRCPTEGR